MSSKLEHNEKDRSQLNSSTLEDLNAQDHHATSMKSMDQNTNGPSMPQRVQRPLSTYTCLGSPIHRATTGIFNPPRKMSIGNDTPSTPLLTTLQSRSRSNSYSAVANSIPALLLPLQHSMYDDLSYTQPIVETTMINSENNPNRVAPKSYTALVSNEFSDDHKDAIEVVHASEKKRAINLEKDERNMTADELRQVLQRERARTAKIQADLQIATLRYNDLSSRHHHHRKHQQQPHYNHPMGESLDSDRIQQGLLTRRQKRKFETVEGSRNN